MTDDIRKRDDFYRKGRRYGLTRIGVRTKPRPCAFCGRVRVTGDTGYCTDEPCAEWHREWLNRATIPERKERLREVARALRKLPPVKPGAAMRDFDAAYNRLVNRGTPEQILNRLAAKLGCEPRQVADRVIRMLEERTNGGYQHDRPNGEE